MDGGVAAVQCIESDDVGDFAGNRQGLCSGNRLVGRMCDQADIEFGIDSDSGSEYLRCGNQLNCLSVCGVLD